MQIIFFIFFILFTLNHLQSSSTSSLLSSQAILRVDNYWVDSLNMNMVGMWNFGYPCAIYAKDNYLYLGSGGCVIIFDLSDSTNPEKIGDISFPGTDVRGIYIQDTLMFIGDGEKGLRIANISDPFQPIEIGSYGSYFSHSVFVRNNLAYVTELNSEIIGELVIYDISNPQEPHILSKDTLPEFHPNDVIVKDKYAYVANGQGGLRVIDVSDSTNPFEISHFIPPIYGTYVNSLALCCDSILLFSAEPGVGNGGLWVINIKDPYDPYPMGCDTSFWVGLDVSYFSHYAYVSSAEDIKIIDFSTLSYPHIVGELHTPFALFNVVNTNIGSIIYAGEWRKNGLRTVNASDPTLPITIDYDIIPDLSIDVSVQGNYAYIANFYSGVYVL
ncbi:hypothetical protein KAX75_00640, partial [candidate division WOR-3 bacterium]|nr:hypothetical protein [candidate division WOR-3 bacterium]